MLNYLLWPIIALILFSCAKKPEYDTVYREAEQTSRSTDYDIDSVYVYLPSTLDTPRYVTVKSPFFQGDETLVKLKWTKEGLAIFAPDEDFRFDFSRNQKPIFTIPGSYRAYRCSTNNLGECTNREEENIEIPWNERPYFDPQLERINFSESLSTLDIYQDDGCILEKNVRLKDYLIKKGIINIELEREFRVSSSDACLSKYLRYEVSKLNTQEFSFKTTFYYSLVRLKDLASPDYKKFNYPLYDQKKFGYFLGFKKKLDANFRKNKKEYLLNRWNPNRKVLTYHLSDSFDEPGMEVFKDATYAAVSDINIILKKSQVPFKIEIKEASGKKSGDLRFNTIVLITGPLKNGLLGYGPTVTNPITGEIIQAHINMYGGVLQSMIPSVYDQMVRLSHSEENLKYKGGEGGRGNPVLTNDTALPAQYYSFPAKKVPDYSSQVDPNLVLNPDYWSSSNSFPPSVKMKKKNAFNERINFFTKHNAYPKELLFSGGLHKNYIPGIHDIKDLWHKNGTLIKWDDLSIGQKKNVTKLVLPLIYKVTFTHEVGHNLGLRHNFKGSLDGKNFWKEDDLKAEVLKSLDGGHEYKLAQYSSIMDYGYSSLNELPTFGKYDIAALRYGYARKIELESNGEGENKMVSLGKNGIRPLHISKLVDYKYCTDENVTADPLCNRFDEGTTFTNIMTHYKNKYESDYYLINYRNDRTNFTSYENLNYFWRRQSEFNRIRNVFEAWEGYAESIIGKQKSARNLLVRREKLTKQVENCQGDSSEYCKAFLDLHNATTMAGKFFLDIIKTPEHACAISTPTGEIVVLLNIIHTFFRLKSAPKSCFDQVVLDEFKKFNNDWKIIGERGKYIKDLRELDPRFPYGSDISVRGIWLDKILAMKFLNGRSLRTYKSDDPEFSFREHPVIGPLMQNLSANMFDQSEFRDVAPFTDLSGNIITKGLEGLIPLRYSGADNPEIKAQNSIYLIYTLNLPWRSSFYLSRPMISIAEEFLQTQSPKIDWLSKIDRDFFRVKKIGDHLSINKSIYPFSYYGQDGFIYAASSSNKLAEYLISGIKLFDSIGKNANVQNYLNNQSEIGNYLTPEDFVSQVYGRKNNPNLYYKKRIKALGNPIETRIDALLVGTNPAIHEMAHNGGLIFKKIVDLALSKEKLELKDFETAFGKIDGESYFKSFQKTNLDEVKTILAKVGAEIDVLNLPLLEIDKLINLGAVDEIYQEEKSFILSKLNKDEIVKIRDWLIKTTEIPEGFLATRFYNFNLDVLKTILEAYQKKDREVLEYTLKHLPIY